VYGHRSAKRTIPISGSLDLRCPASGRNIPADLRARRILGHRRHRFGDVASAGLLGANPTFHPRSGCEMGFRTSPRFLK